jgi:nitric oxide reductase NorD protein
MDKAPAYGALRDEFLARQQEARQPDAPMFDAVEKPDDEGARDHDEWDDAAGTYRLAAVRVAEVEAPPGPVEGYTRIVEANRRQIAQIRRRFEALRVEERWLHGVADGPELDLNRVIAAVVDIEAGQEPDDRLYARFVREKQTVAILTLVDQSGSTQGHVIHLEQEALVLCAEGLRALGHPHAFYGFGNARPDICDLWRIKGFDEPWGEAVHKRLGNLRAAGATRLGAYLRHAGWLLAQRPQARRILMVVSDGRPEDRGDYRGKYGIRDAAMAVQEIRRVGVHPFCVSLDPGEDADTYLEPIFGKGKFLKLENPDQLPNRLPEVFRHLVR